MAKLFISHAVKDKELADELVDLLQITTGIFNDDIFCVSIEGMGIPTGKNFIEYIKEKIQRPELVIILLSPNYYESHFCLCELGAAWAMSLNQAVLLVPPLKTGDLKGVLTGIQITKINDSEKLDEFIEEFNKILSIESFKLPRWNTKKDNFLKKLPIILDSLPKPLTISSDEHQKVVHELSEYKVELINTEAEVDRLKIKIQDLKKCKDIEEVMAVERKSMPEADVFAELCKKITKEMEKLPRAVQYFVAEKYIGDGCEKLNYVEQKDLYEDSIKARKDGYLSEDDGLFCLIVEDEMITNVIDSIDEIEDFFNEASNSFNDFFYKENGFKVSLKNKKMWSKFLAPKNYYLR